MALLKSVDNVPGINFYEYRDQDYYGKYRYRARFNLDGIRYTWWAKTVDDIKAKLGKRGGIGGITKYDQPAVTQNIDALEAYINWRNTNLPKKPKNKDLSARIEYKTCAIFSNDLSLLKTLDNLHPNIVVDYTECQTSEYSGIKHFVKEPKHKYRVYLKSRRIEKSFVTDLKALMDRITGLYPSPSLDDWLKSYRDGLGGYSQWRYYYSSSAHFIEYDDESTLSYLALMHGDMLGKKYKLEKRPEDI